MKLISLLFAFMVLSPWASGHTSPHHYPRLPHSVIIRPIPGTNPVGVVGGVTGGTVAGGVLPRH